MNRILIFIFLGFLTSPSNLIAGKKHILYWSVVQNDAVNVPKLLQGGTNPNGKSNRFIPYHAAIQKNYLSMAGLLSLYGANVNVKDYDGFSILHKMALEGNLDMCIFLLNQKAGINTFTAYCHNTALHLICSRVPRTHDCHTINASIAQLFMNSGANVELMNKQKQTALNLAETTGQYMIVKLLTEEQTTYEKRLKLLKGKSFQQLFDIFISYKVN